MHFAFLRFGRGARLLLVLVLGSATCSPVSSGAGVSQSPAVPSGVKEFSGAVAIRTLVDGYVVTVRQGRTLSRTFVLRTTRAFEQAHADAGSGRVWLWQRALELEMPEAGLLLRFSLASDEGGFEPLTLEQRAAAAERGIRRVLEVHGGFELASSSTPEAAPLGALSATAPGWPGDSTLQAQPAGPVTEACRFSGQDAPGACGQGCGEGDCQVVCGPGYGACCACSQVGRFSCRCLPLP